MRRFEQHSEQGTRFWEIELVGTELTLRSGKVGSRALPEEREESYRNATEARREHDRLVKSRLANGWVEIVARATAEEFEATLARDDEKSWLVFADRLQAEGDVRGDLIALQHSLGRRRDAKKQVDAFVERHDEALLGPLAAYKEQLELTWRFGYLREAGLHCRPVSEYSFDPQAQQPIEDLLPVLLKLESSRFLRVLALGWPEPNRDCTYEPIIELLRREPWPKYLEGLVLGDFTQSTALSSVAGFNDQQWLDEETEQDLWPDLRSLAPLADRLQTLSSLTVRANLRRLGVARLPALRAFELHVQHLEGALVDEVLRLEAPALESFVMDCPHSPAVTPASFGDVLHGHLFPRLTRLGLNGLGLAALDALAGARLLPKLTSIDLSGNDLGDEQLAQLAQHRAAFAHLDKVVLRRNLFSKAGAKEVKAVLPNADLAHQRARRRPRAERFDGVGE